MGLENGIVLPGITRESLIQLLEEHAAGSSSLLEGLPRKLRVVQRDISMPEIVDSIADGSLKA
jgi:branched-chain amino acid aminotransferase